MSVKNAYPELPEIEFKRTKADMNLVIAFAKSLVGKYTIDTVRMAYAIFRNESANGTKGVNNNYAGIQADVGRWKSLPGTPIATCTKVDSGNANRRFLCFSDQDGYKICFELLCVKITSRGMVSVDDYFNKWVGNPNATSEHKKNFQSLLNSAAKVI